MVVNVRVIPTIGKFLSVIHTISIIVIVFVVVNAVIVVVHWVIISHVGDSIVIIIGV